MTNFHGNMTCEEFQAQLPELIRSGKFDSNHPHLRDCELCQALLADLETIAEAARQLFPIEEPPPKLWEKIESALKSEEGAITGDDDETDGDLGAEPEKA